MDQNGPRVRVRKLSDVPPKRRSRAEAEVAKAKSAHERTLKNLIYGHITTESWLAVRPELERNIALAEAELARTEAPPKIDLHPAAVANYKSALDNLHEVMCQDTEDANEAFSTSLSVRAAAGFRHLHAEESAQIAPGHNTLAGYGLLCRCEPLARVRHQLRAIHAPQDEQ